MHQNATAHSPSTSASMPRAPRIAGNTADDVGSAGTVTVATNGPVVLGCVVNVDAIIAVDVVDKLLSTLVKVSDNFVVGIACVVVSVDVGIDTILLLDVLSSIIVVDVVLVVVTPAVVDDTHVGCCRQSDEQRPSATHDAREPTQLYAQQSHHC